MAGREDGETWRVIAHSVRGASHFRSGQPNQDAFLHIAGCEGFPQAILAVSDGHGSEASFRSDLGSKLAVMAGVQANMQLLSMVDSSSPETLPQALEGRLPQLIVKTWRRMVTQHYGANPFTAAELETLVAKRGESAKAFALSPQKYFLAYGATLLSAVLLDQCAIFFRIGDGELILVSEKSAPPTRTVFDDDASMVGDVTMSLCSDNAVQASQLRVESFAGGLPDLIALSTDGLDKSFRTKQDFLKVGLDLLRMLRDDGPAQVDASLPGALRNITTNGSGDDITLALAWRPSALRPATPAEKPAQKEVAPSPPAAAPGPAEAVPDETSCTDF